MQTNVFRETLMMKRLIHTMALLVAVSLLGAGLVYAEEITGKQIIDKIRVQESYTDTMIKIKMTLVNKRNETRERMIVNRIKKIGGLSRTMTTFLFPDDVKGTKFLTIENEGRDDDQFLFLPALDKVRRISSNQKGQSFMGTDFSYSDLSSRDPEEGAHTKLRSENKDGFDCYVVESVPDPEDTDTAYAKIITWVRTDIWVPVYIEFYDKKTGELLKVLTAGEFQKTDDIWMAHHTEMKDVRKDHKTVIEIKSVENNQGLTDDDFSQRFLKDKTRL